MKHEQVVENFAIWPKLTVMDVRKSELGIEEDVEEEIGFKCPKCSFVNPKIEHGFRGQCPNCGLHFQVFGNGLDCSNTPFVPSNFENQSRHSRFRNFLIRFILGG